MLTEDRIAELWMRSVTMLAFAQALEAEVSRWRPIAPKPVDGEAQPTVAPWDGEPVLILTDHSWTNRVHRVVWTDAVHGHGIFSWALEDHKHGPYPLRGYSNVTHWQPLPLPPTKEQP